MSKGMNFAKPQLGRNEIIVNGCGCVWFDYKSRCGVRGAERLPCCPICGSVLLEQSASQWFDGIEVYDKSHPGYKSFMVWLQGKCFRSFDVAKENYTRETGEVVE